MAAVFHDAAIAKKGVVSPAGELLREMMGWLRSEIDDDSGLPSNTWLRGSWYQVYVRYTFHYIEDAKERYIDIASIEFNPEMRGQGIFTEVLAEFERECQTSIFIENVHNERLADFLMRNGYTRHGDTKIMGVTEHGISYYKKRVK